LDISQRQLGQSKQGGWSKCERSGLPSRSATHARSPVGASLQQQYRHCFAPGSSSGGRATAEAVALRARGLIESDASLAVEILADVTERFETWSPSSTAGRHGPAFSPEARPAARSRSSEQSRVYRCGLLILIFRAQPDPPPEDAARRDRARSVFMWWVTRPLWVLGPALATIPLLAVTTRAAAKQVHPTRGSV
jgi:hypothetical protein